ncbi:hypothetical protein [Marinomonas lutimaris]|uniref:hypothetical protein n=1 Tax=Marinomonas lutimaris TaxID=2846746 RepID=UPI001CA4D63E|nr:hypothetical protein [Marinomonas lutimaris]
MLSGKKTANDLLLGIQAAPNLLRTAKALSRLSSECSSVIREFYRAGLQETPNCQQLVTTLKLIDNAMKDIGTLKAVSHILEALTADIQFHHPNFDVQLAMCVREHFFKQKSNVCKEKGVREECLKS